MIANFASLRTPDFAAIGLLPSPAAHGALVDALQGWQWAEERAFAVRGYALGMIDSAQSYRLETDPRSGFPFTSMDAFIEARFPEHERSFKESLAVRRKLPSLAFEDFARIKRGVLLRLIEADEKVRTLPDVIADAKRLPEWKFVEQINQTHEQHLETRKPILLAPAGDMNEFERAITVATELEGCKTRQEAIKAISINYLQENEAEYMRKVEHTA